MIIQMDGGTGNIYKCHHPVSTPLWKGGSASGRVLPEARVAIGHGIAGVTSWTVCSGIVPSRDPHSHVACRASLDGR